MLTILDKNHKEILYDLPYYNLVWNSRWYDFGEFQVQINLDDYKKYDGSNWAYIVSSEHEEIGIIQKLEYSDAENRTLLLSGLFAESVLNNAIAMTSAAVGGETVAVASEFFLKSYYINQTAVSGSFPIVIGSSDTVDCIEFRPGMGGELGSEFLNIMQPLGCTYRITRKPNGYEYAVKKGRDNTSVVLDTQYGDIVNPKVTIDKSGYKNAALVKDKDDAGQDFTYVYRAGETVPSGQQRRIFVNMPKNSEADATVLGREELAKSNAVIDIDAEIYDVQNYQYLLRIGDIVKLRIAELDIEMTTRIVELTTVYNSDGKSISVGFGDKRIPNVKRLVDRWLR